MAWDFSQLHQKHGLILTYLKHLLPAIKGMFSDTFKFRQDSAPAHRAPEIVKPLSHTTPDFISPDLWPSNSPDLNPADYRTWDAMQQSMCRTKTNDLWKHLKQTGLGKKLAWLWTDATIWDHVYSECVSGRHFRHTHARVSRLLFRDYPGEPLPER